MTSIVGSCSQVFTVFSVMSLPLGFDCPVFDDLFNCVCNVAGATLGATEMLNKRECNIAINWQGGWHHAQRYHFF